jgi:outer membrane protein W
MKILILTFLILVTPFHVHGQNVKNDMSGKIGITLYGGGNIPTNGDYLTNIKTTEFLNTGSQFGLGLSYFITKGFGIEGTLYAGYNYHNDKYRPAGKEPVWVNLSSSINAIYNFGHMIKKASISPFIRIGAGSYQWEHFEDGIIGGDITSENNNHNINSWGFNIGAGAEYNLNKKLSVGLLFDYNIFFPKSENEIKSLNNDERTRHGFFAPQLKLSYYIPTR